MNMRKILALLLALTVMLALCACGGKDQAEEAPENNAPVVQKPAEEQKDEAPAEEKQEEQDDRITYTVHVVDEEGNPFAGTLVQMCQGENCTPAPTDATGAAVFKMAEEADYEVKLIQMPEGYTYAEDAEAFHFAVDSYEMTITLKAVA